MLNISWRERNLKIYYGYYMGKFDNIEGQQLKNAYKNFQKNNGLVADSIYGNATNDKLVSVIKNLQQLLRNKGYNITVDGLAGDQTYNAVGDFQSKNGLVVDKIAGSATFAKLNSGGISWDDIPHFKKSEMTCKCGCGTNNTDLRLMQVLEQIRSHFGGKPVIITSGCRCSKHNREVGGVQGSRHVLGKAADIYIKGVPTSQLLNYCQSLVNQGILRYTYTNSKNMNGIVHIDIN